MSNQTISTGNPADINAVPGDVASYLDEAACIFEQLETLFLTIRQEAEGDCSATIITNLAIIGARIGRDHVSLASRHHDAARRASREVSGSRQPGQEAQP